MTAPTQPTGVQYRRLVGWMMNVSGDPVLGTVYKFEAAPNRVYDTSATPPPIINTDPVYGRFGADHIMRDQAGNEGVWIVDPNDPTLSPTGFNYRVTVEAPGCKAESFNIDIPSGSGDVDLATVMPVDPRLGTPNVKGDKGDKGEPSTVPGPPGAGDFEIDAYYLAQITAVAGEPLTVAFGGVLFSETLTLSGDRSVFTVVDIAATTPATTFVELRDPSPDNGNLVIGVDGTGGRVYGRLSGGSNSAFIKNAALDGPDRVGIGAWIDTTGGLVGAATDSGWSATTALTGGGTPSTTSILRQNVTTAAGTRVLTAAWNTAPTPTQATELATLMLAWADARDSHFVPPLSWDEITGKPAVIGAGATQAAARTAIGAGTGDGTSDLVLGTTAGTALEGDTAIPSTAADVDAVESLIGDTKLWRGTQAAYDGLSPASDTVYIIQS